MEKINYINYTYKELLSDDFFIESVLNPTSESEQFWNDLSKDNKELTLNITRAKRVIMCLPYRYQEITSKQENELLDRIIRKIHKDKKQKNIKKISYIITSSVAVIALLLILNISHITTIFERDHFSIEMINKPELYGTQIQLIKANDKLTIEGEEPVIQYDNKGLLSINSKKQKISQPPVPGDQTHYHQLIIPYAKRSFLTLSDGTNIWVNANTRLVYPEVFDKDKREIYVDGEIFLEVAPDKRRPFLVKTNTLEVNVLGTSFNVSAYENDDYASVVLVTGNVNVTAKGKKQTNLNPNDMLFFSDNQLSISQVHIENYTSWRLGTYVFNKEKFSVVLRKLSRYYGKELVLSGISDEFYCSGTLNLREDLSALLRGLEKVYPITFVHKDNKIIVNIESKNK
jgi:Fe2+-dicitrate sensor, membrane component